MLRGALLLGLLVLCMSTTAGPALAFNPWTFPPLPPPEQYGNILINRTSTANGLQPVGFSHLSHRLLYTCRVCHLELGFEMFVNTTEITEGKNLQGHYCGACHNGKIAFGHTREHCQKCHSGSTAFGEAAFAKLGRLPRTAFGNRIDWVYAMYEKLIHPQQSLIDKDYKPLDFNKKLSLESRWSGTPPAIFPHEPHNLWLDCSNCHPDIFNIQKKTTEHFEMNYIVQRKFCGVCHLKVAFPLDDCRRCHPGMKK
ncbi:MAG: hypothetical protein COX17_05490 [Deltaproteobacteria bacterium CG23_combo_of_CG06-09_8_20_14_all_60_8]|nr:MAG: hypothetical protein AUK28_02205 [Desulfobacterales bacterium CG2_30_60_27]PIP43715.1 MAG: hypothetical protein COX17_05490 [Deltaproteobacteria bacterium CG23_combo_of_CG06-09_8_20_14_all_60_8]